MSFDYATAFSRNLGFVTRAEQERLRQSRVAIAGLGGVGGSHLLTLARLGVGRFTVAEFDRFDLANFNRQAGATCSTLGQRKIDVLARMALDINPELDLRLNPNGVRPHQADDFLAGADLYVDSIDLFATEARAEIFACCERRGIPAITAAPIGFGCAWMVFRRGGTSFADYMRWQDAEDDIGRVVRMIVGLSPRFLHHPYLVAPEFVDPAGRRVPSTCAGIEQCAGIVGAEAVKLLLKRGRVLASPWGHQFDAYRGCLSRTWRPWGNRNPLQRWRLALVERWLRRQLAAA